MFSRLDSRNTTSNEPTASNYKSDIEISKYKRESKGRYGNKIVSFYFCKLLSNLAF